MALPPPLLFIFKIHFCRCEPAKASRRRDDISHRQIRASLQLILLCFPLLNTQSTKGKMSMKQTRSRRVADNYRRAPHKCQYVKVGAVCEANGDKRHLKSDVGESQTTGSKVTLSAPFTLYSQPTNYYSTKLHLWALTPTWGPACSSLIKH